MTEQSIGNVLSLTRRNRPGNVRHRAGNCRSLGLALLTLIALASGCVTTSGRSCDRTCLDVIAKQYLQSVVAHDPSLLKLARDVRFTEDSRDLKPGEGFWATASGLRQHRLNVLDPELGAAVGLAVMEEGGQPVLLAYRLKVKERAISEIETLVVKTNGNGNGNGNERALFGREMLGVPRIEFLEPVPAGQESRAELLRISQFYPDGLKAGSFVKVDAPFAEGARRLENGAVTAGPDCARDTCKNIKTQSSPTRPTLRQRLLAVDEQQGISFYWFAWEQQNGNTLLVWEAFKVYGGKIHGVEAFIKRGDPAIGSGWK